MARLGFPTLPCQGWAQTSWGQRGTKSGGHREVRTCPRATDPSKEGTKEPPAQILSCPSPAGWQEHWGRLWGLHGAARHRQRCLQTWRTRTKCQLQKNVHVGIIRKRPQGDPQKDDTNQKNGPMGLWTTDWILMSVSHRDVEAGELPFPVVVGDLTATCKPFWCAGWCYMCLLAFQLMTSLNVSKQLIGTN